MHTHIYIHIYIYVFIHIHICTYIYTSDPPPPIRAAPFFAVVCLFSAHVCVYTYTQTNIYRYIHTYIRTHIHTNTYTYIYVYIYIYIPVIFHHQNPQRSLFCCLVFALGGFLLILALASVQSSQRAGFSRRLRNSR